MAAVTRIHKRLHKRAPPIPPPQFHCFTAPFSRLSEEELLSRDVLLAVILTDVQYIADQARYDWYSWKFIRIKLFGGLLCTECSQLLNVCVFTCVCVHV